MLIKQRIKIKFPISNFQFPKNFGFSLLELLVVISIIAILTAVLTTNFMGMRERARDAQKIQDLGSVKNALRMFYNDNQSYPDDGVAAGSFCSNNCLDATEVGTTYLPSLVGVGYSYQQNNNGDGFILKVGLEVGAGTDDTDSQLKCGIGVGFTADKVFAVCAN